MKRIAFILSLGMAVLMTACSGDDYINVIPSDSIALMAVDMNNVEKPQLTVPPKIETLPFVADRFGIDLSVPVYAFETKDGNIGVCAKVDDADDVKKCIDEVLVSQEACKPLAPKKDFLFTVVSDKWVLGLSDEALLVMGPVVPAAQPQLQLQMAKYLQADAKKGAKESPLFARLDSLSAPVRLVAQAQALPEQVAAVLTIGAPKEADASQVLVAAELQADGECLVARSQTFSLNEQIDAAIRGNQGRFRPVGDHYLMSLSDEDAAAVFVNVEGGHFLEMVKANKTLQLLLSGINTAVDMDNIIRSIDGEAAFWLHDSRDGQMAMAAQLAKTDFLADVDYWKKSAPKGMSIIDQGVNAYAVSGGDTRFCFGVTADKQFYAGSSDSVAASLGKTAAHPMPQQVTQRLKGQRVAVALQLPRLLGEQSELVMSLLQPLFGSPRYVIYSLK